jgi:Domain of unknown function (DUF4332)
MPKEPANRRKSRPEIDDLTRLHAIGPKAERLLLEAGITTYADLAASEPQQLNEVLRRIPSMTMDRIEAVREEAAGLAGLIHAGPAAATSLPRERHTFTLELVLDAGGRTDSTRIAHAQTGAEEVYEGWDAERLDQFVREQAVLKRDRAGRPAVLPVAEEAGAEPTSVQTVPTTLVPALDPSEQPATPTVARAAGESPPAVAPLIVNVGGASQPTRTLIVRCEPSIFDLTPDVRAEAIATIYARHLDTGRRLVFASDPVSLSGRGSVQIPVPLEALAEGIWRIDGVVSLRSGSMRDGRPEAFMALTNAHMSVQPGVSSATQ